MQFRKTADVVTSAAKKIGKVERAVIDHQKIDFEIAQTDTQHAGGQRARR